MSNPDIRMIGGPPRAGECKLRIKSDGTSDGTSIVVVDDQGVERAILGAEAVSWKLAAGLELARACVRVIESEVDLDAEKVEIRKSDGGEPTAEDFEIHGFACSTCGHTHTSRQFAFICIGCPCPYRPPTKERAPLNREEG